MGGVPPAQLDGCTLRNVVARATGAWRPWARLMAITSEPHRDRDIRRRPYTESYFHPLLDEDEDENQTSDAAVPLTGQMAARIGDILERRKERAKC